jgi:hypothetical protein
MGKSRHGSAAPNTFDLLESSIQKIIDRVKRMSELC